MLFFIATNVLTCWHANFQLLLILQALILLFEQFFSVFLLTWTGKFPLLNQVWKLDAMYSAAVFAVDACEKTHGCNVAQQTSCLQKRILDYFKGDDNSDVLDKMGRNR